MTTEIKHNWTYSYSIDEVWEYLTQAKLIEKWLMPNDFKPILGQEFMFKTNPILSLDLSGNFYCKVLEITPKTKLIYSWKGGKSETEISLDTVVEWNLKAVENGTELSLIHTGFKNENYSILTSMYEGWNMHINKMITQLNEESNGNSTS